MKVTEYHTVSDLKNFKKNQFKLFSNMMNIEPNHCLISLSNHKDIAFTITEKIPNTYTKSLEGKIKNGIRGSLS